MGLTTPPPKQYVCETFGGSRYLVVFPKLTMTNGEEKE